MASSISDRVGDDDQHYQRICDAGATEQTVEIDTLIRLLNKKTAGALSSEDEKSLQDMLSSGREYAMATSNARGGSNRLFKTKNEHLGLGPYKVMANDEV